MIRYGNTLGALTNDAGQLETKPKCRRDRDKLAVDQLPQQVELENAERAGHDGQTPMA